MRAVVKLLHPPDDLEIVAHCLAAARELDADWRGRVGARFEVVVQGTGPVLLVAHLFGVIVNLAHQETIGLWQAGQPVPIRRNLTREDAEQITQGFGLDLSRWAGPDEPLLKMTVRSMEQNSPPVRLALSAGSPPG